MDIIWDGSSAIATKINFTLDVNGQIYTEKDGCFVITQKGKQFVATEEEIIAEQQRFADMYDWEEGYKSGAELDTEESEDYIEGCRRMIY